MIRNLVDYTLGSRRRTEVFEQRLRKVACKVVKIKKLLKAGVRTRKFAVCVVGSTVKCGGNVLGASLRQVKHRRAAVHHCVTRRPQGRSATLDCALVRGDPYVLDPGYFLTASPIRDLAAALWDGWVPCQWIYRTWNAAFNAAVAADFS